jgi:hypothetical protein
LFDPAAVEQIAAYSAGIPAQINVICDNALLSAYAAAERTVSAETIHKVFRTLHFTEAGEVSPSRPADEHVATESIAEEQPVRPEMYTRALSAAEPIVGLPPPRRGKVRVGGLFSPSTSAVVAGILLLVAAAAMLYLERGAVRLEASARASATPSEPDDSGYTEDFSGADADFAPATRGTSPGENAVPSVVTPPAPSSAAWKDIPKDFVVYMHVAEERNWQVLESIGGALRENGYSVPVTRYGASGTQGDVRFFFVQDRRQAERVKFLVEAELGSAGYPVSLELVERDGRQSEFAAPGKIEVWLPPLRNAES